MEMQVISESELILMRIIWSKGGVAMFAGLLSVAGEQYASEHRPHPVEPDD